MGCRLSTKFEFRNTKQIRNPNFQMFETKEQRYKGLQSIHMAIYFEIRP